ncbi:MAG: HU family DNA-binding protein [Rickettsiaceae bacterium]
MNKQGFIKYISDRYGIEENTAETMVDIFTDSLHDLVVAGYSINIDEIGEFKTTPLFPKGLQCLQNNAVAKLAKRNIVCFMPSEKLTEEFA